MMMSLPSKVKIGEVVYTVGEFDGLTGTGADGESVWLNGRIRDTKAIIHIEESIDEQVKPVVLLHESLHAILLHSGQSDHDEEVIHALGYGLLAFMRDNADWIRSIL
jgi:hypothetical protein